MRCNNSVILHPKLALVHRRSTEACVSVLDSAARLCCSSPRAEVFHELGKRTRRAACADAGICSNGCSQERERQAGGAVGRRWASRRKAPRRHGADFVAKVGYGG